MGELSQTKNHRGLGKRIKYALPDPAFDVLRTAMNGAASLIPSGVKYGAASVLRKRKYPYSVVRPGDIVVQAGAPRDLLSAGRSRAVHFAKLVAHGKVVVIEPDPQNCEALQDFIAANAFAGSIELVQQGLWSEPGELNFLSSPRHPAANVLVDAKEIDDSVMQERGYSVIKVPVNTLDSILAKMRLPVPRLVSLTTNGAEPEILNGMSKTIASGLSYVSLASTNQGYPELMRDLNFDMIAIDDRGYTFENKNAER